MNRSIASAALAALVAVPMASATEIETFNSPNLQQVGQGNYGLNRDTGAWINGANSTVVQTFGADFYGISSTPAATKGGYGSGYHNIFTQNSPPPGGSNGVIDISGNSMLQLDVAINGGTTAGLFVDLMDGEGDFYQYFFGYGLTGNAATDSANAVGNQFVPGETVTQGSQPNEEIFRVPLATPKNDLNGTGTFDLTQLTLYRIENDPGATGGTGNPSNISFYDLSAVNVPEPTGLAVAAVGCLLAARRRR